jgi:hypothetical protein
VAIHSTLGKWGVEVGSRRRSGGLCAGRGFGHVTGAVVGLIIIVEAVLSVGRGGDVYTGVRFVDRCRMPEKDEQQERKLLRSLLYLCVSVCLSVYLSPFQRVP